MNNPQHAKLLWRCRRGMLELDLMLIPFAEQEFPNLSPEEQATFEELLTATDPELFSWLTDNGTPDNPKFAALIQRIRAHAREQH
ncbi:MAG: succinate dehydrogenase assembly factor 2 family protein [Legionellales bacterium]|nr:succinate dehydrogenase assembly factor 2 family protein [Legionellales bacterium]|tara:strand:+ start:1346 stop:1600 length:255 start_codon:yes stop_codon:yes gene_type:complete